MNAIGEIHAFGAVGPLFGQPRENILWPALRRWPETTGRWQQALEPGIGWTIAADGQLYGWDTLEWTRVPLPPGVRSWTAVAAGDRHTLAIGDDCQLYASGSNGSGQLGLGSTASQVMPMPVPFVGNLCGIPIIYTQGETTLLPDGSFRLVFRSDLNRRYLIQYSEDAIVWKNAMPPLTGSGDVTEWIDDGPPKTETHPSGVSRRYYRVAFAP